MSGLRAWQRDVGLPAAAGDAGNCPPAPDDVLDRVRAALLVPGSPPVVAAACEYVRWKPAESITALYRLTFADLEESVVVVKRYAARGKLATLADRRWLGQRQAARPARLRPLEVFPDERLVLWAFPAERVLRRGLDAAFDGRRLARLVEGESGLPARTLRRSGARVQLVRYKPERRAVLRARFRVRRSCPGLARGSTLETAVRALPHADAMRSLHARRALESADPNRAVPIPRLIACHPGRGLLVEPWLPVTAAMPTDFAHAAAAGRSLAALHAVAAPPDVPAAPAARLGELVALFERAPGSAALAAGLREPRPEPGGRFVHGDLHPDQLARGPGGDWTLLDLDLLGRGEPARDLASWLADHLISDPEMTFAAAAAPLVAGYRSAGGTMPPRARLRTLTAAELVHRAAAALRRLEVGAVDKAAATLARARLVAPPGEIFQ